MRKQFKSKESAAKSLSNCTFCGKLAEGNYSIHRDGFGEGPEVPLCDGCGGRPTPTEQAIWARIGQSDICLECGEEIRHDDERKGSYHGWCYP
jgi:hypothetical protein